MPFTFFPLRAPGTNAFSAAGHLSPSYPALHLRFAPTSLPLHSLSVVSFLFDLPHLSHLVALARSFKETSMQRYPEVAALYGKAAWLTILVSALLT